MARRAYALATLLEQVNTLYPNRNKGSDGWLGDAAHQKTKSEHNPNTKGVVTAQDFTHDPANGVHGGDLAEWFNDDSRTWYVIWNRKIWDVKWIPYWGKNPHDRHVHISVRQNAGNYDNNSKWKLGGDMPTPTRAEILSQFKNFTGTIPTESQINHYTRPEQGWGALNGDLLQFNFDRNPPVNEGDAVNLYRHQLRREPKNGEEKGFIGKTFKDAWYLIVQSEEGNAVSGKIGEQETKITEQAKIIAKYQASGGDATKFQTLGVLIRELLGLNKS